MSSNQNSNYIPAFQYSSQSTNYPQPPPYNGVAYVPIPVQTNPYAYQSPIQPVYVQPQNPFVTPTAPYPPVYPPTTNLYPQMPPAYPTTVNVNQGVTSPQRVRPMSPPVQRFTSPSSQRPTSPPAHRDAPELTVDQILAMNHTKRCKRCTKYYKEDQSKSACKYHSGTYRLAYESSIAPIRFSSWSCCGGLERDSAGCKLGDHIEDRETTAKLHMYDNLAAQAPQPQYTSEEPITNDLIDLNFKVEEIKPEPVKKTGPVQKITRTDKIVTSETEEYIKHHVRLTDTIAGLSLKYRVAAEKIKRLNKIRTDKELWTRPEVKIPVEGAVELEISEAENERIREDMKRRLNNRFRRVTGTKTEEEARYYLESNDYNFDRAITEHSHDLYWQQHNPATTISKKVY